MKTFLVKAFSWLLDFPFVDGVPQLPTRTKRLALLRKMVREVQPKRCLEVGSLFGTATEAIAEYAEQVVCADIEFRPPFREKFRRDELLGKKLTLLEGDSRETLPKLAPRQFDLIYLDGDHRYPVVESDMIQAKRLIRPGGIVCGDDLELCLRDDAKLLLEAEQHKHEDFYRFYHPGCSVAVYRHFPEALHLHGFWWTTES